MKIEWNLWLTDDNGGQRGVMIKGETMPQEAGGVMGYSLSFDKSDNGTLSDQELLAVTAITEVARCLLRKQDITRYFNPTVSQIEENQELLQCKWMRSGKLRLVGPATKRYLHAMSPEEAMQRRRVFTCTRSVYERTSKWRSKLYIPRRSEETDITQGQELC